MSKTKKIIVGVVLGCILLIGFVLGGFYFYKYNKVLTVITLDINPSLELGLNYKDEVVKIKGLNKDGKQLLKQENFKGDDLEDAIEEITELVIENGYISEEENHILISVNGKDIQKRVVNLFNREFKEEKIDCNIIVQKIDDEAKVNAEKYGISENKASYIEDIIKENEDLTFEELKDKSISEINEYLEKTEENIKEEETPKEDNQQNTTTNGNANTGNNKPSAKPVSKTPASNDRTGAWCEFYKTIPPEGGVEYETPGIINDLATYAEAAKKIMPEDASWSSYFSSMTDYKTASYCTAGIIELENYDKTKTYRAYLDSVTLELLEPVKVIELEKPNVDEAGAKVIVTKWLSKTYGVNINDCDWENYYYAIDGSTKKPEWQYTCKIEETKTYYAVVVNAITGDLSLGRTWTN